MTARALLVVVALLFGAAGARADGYPVRPVTLVVPFSAGGGTDIIGRILAHELSAQLGQSVIVDNRGGAGTAIGTNVVAKAKPDGYTILLNGSTLTFHPALLKHPPYDVARDLRPVTFVSHQPYVLVVTNNFPAHSLGELVARAKAEPGTITYASAGTGSAMHLAAELLWRKLGIEMVHVPYKGTGPATADVISGEVKAMVTTAAGAADMVKAGRMRALGISSAARSPATPDLLTFAEAGFPGLEAASWTALFVPAATPEPVVATLHDAAVRALAAPALQEKFAGLGLDVRTGTVAETGAFVRDEIVRWTAIIQAAGIEGE
jgi:tripartite-type tricarboxylate transporter receptor subunit TctC